MDNVQIAFAFRPFQRNEYIKKLESRGFKFLTTKPTGEWEPFHFEDGVEYLNHPTIEAIYNGPITSIRGELLEQLYNLEIVGKIRHLHIRFPDYQ